MKQMPNRARFIGNEICEQSEKKSTYAVNPMPLPSSIARGRRAIGGIDSAEASSGRFGDVAWTIVC